MSSFSLCYNRSMTESALLTTGTVHACLAHDGVGAVATLFVDCPRLIHDGIG